MKIISISHKTAPVEIRELFSFTAEETKAFLFRAKENEHIEECVLVSTCNRTEIYFCGDTHSIEVMEQLLASSKNAELELLLKYFLIYCDEKAIRHLFRVTCGMDSMVIGEDEILGQIKNAYETALGLGTTKYMLNTLFQAAITCAKRIKTDTMISKTPISIGTLTANEIMRFPKQKKKILIIGLTGKMGSVVMKNIYYKNDIEIIGTSRRHNTEEYIGIKYSKVKIIDYLERYQSIDDVDIIISATTSPHYTLTYHELKDHIQTEKERLFIDLSVPMDIDKDIAKIKNARIYDIDYFNQASHNNSRTKKNEELKAEEILEEYLEEVGKELSFHDFIDDIPRVQQQFNKKTFQQILYELKEKSSKEELNAVLNLFRKL